MKSFFKYLAGVALGTLGFAAMSKLTHDPDFTKSYLAAYFFGLLLFGLPTLICGVFSSASWSTYSVELGWAAGALVFAGYFGIVLLPALFWLRSGKKIWKWLQTLIATIHLCAGLGLAAYLLWF
jgi:hypothetical protein